MKSNVTICLILLSSIAFIILAWTFFARRRGEFKRALLMTHHASQSQSQPPLQLQARDLSSDTPSSESNPTQSTSTSSGGTVSDYRKAKKGRGQPKRPETGKTGKMAGGLARSRVDGPSVAATRESTAPAVDAGTGTGAGRPSSEDRETGGWSGQGPVDTTDGGWGGVSATQENQGWGDENSDLGVSSAW